jgi:hypothetical protein
MKRIAMPLLGALFLSVASCGSDAPGMCQGDECGGSGGSTGGSGGGAGGGGGSSAAPDRIEFHVDGKVVTDLSIADTETVKVEAVGFLGGKVVSPMPPIDWKKAPGAVGTVDALKLDPGVPMASATGVQDFCKAGTTPKDPRLTVGACVGSVCVSIPAKVAPDPMGTWDVTRTVPGYPPTAYLIVVKSRHGTTIDDASSEGSQGTSDGWSGEISDGQFKLIKKNPASGGTSTYTGTLACDKTIKGKLDVEGEVTYDFTMKHR